MKKLFIILLLLSLFGCNVQQPEAEKKQTEQTNKLLDEANRQIGLPNIVNFQQKKTMKMSYEETDKENLICYAYIKSDYQGKLVFIGLSYHLGTLPQADPNGLYMPTSSSATWLMMIDPKTKKARPVYIEPEIVVSPFPLTKGTS